MSEGRVNGKGEEGGDEKKEGKGDIEKVQVLKKKRHRGNV